MRRNSDIRLQNVVTRDRETSDRGHLVTLSLCPVFETFDFKNAVTLEIGLGVCRGH